MAARAVEEKLTGLQKAAVLLIALGPEKSASIFKHLKEEEIESLTLEIANTRSITPQVKESAVYCGRRYQLRQRAFGAVFWCRESNGCYRQTDGILTGKTFRVCQKDGCNTAA